MILLGAAAFVVLAGLGALARAVLARFDAGLPFGTIGANTLASFFAGLVAASERPTAVLVGVALCGTLSTFSTLVHHLHDQALHNRPARVATTLGVAIGAGILAALAGLELAAS
ncbi:MAG: CrcB family protein [Acidimicrobiales bacterium]